MQASPTSTADSGNLSACDPPLLANTTRVPLAQDEAKFSAIAADGVRLYRPGNLPVIGKEAAAVALQATPPAITFAEPKGEIAPSGDLGFAWGEYTASEKGGYYLRIWRKHEAGKWQLALDLLHPR